MNSHLHRHNSHPTGVAFTLNQYKWSAGFGGEYGMTHGFAGATRTSVGLYDMRARHYSPMLGAFLTQDPLGPVDGPDRWLYAVGDPVNFSDRLGLWAHTPNPSEFGRDQMLPDPVPSQRHDPVVGIPGQLEQEFWEQGFGWSPHFPRFVWGEVQRMRRRATAATVDVASDVIPYVDEPSEIIHTTLDCFGMSECPLVSQGADGLNAAIYVIEGRDADAAISAAAVVGPGVVGALIRFVRRGQRLRRALKAANNALRGVDGSLWQAHHLIPLNLANNSNWIEFFDRARRAGWDIDSAENGIALATSDSALQELGSTVQSTLLHNSNHSNYSQWVDQEITDAIARALVNNGMESADELTGAMARDILESVQDTARGVFSNNGVDSAGQTYDWVVNGYVRK